MIGHVSAVLRQPTKIHRQPPLLIIFVITVKHNYKRVMSCKANLLFVCDVKRKQFFFCKLCICLVMILNEKFLIGYQQQYFTHT